MKRVFLGLWLSVSLLGLLLLQSSGQTCATQSRTVTGYANGDRSTLSVMSGIIIDPAGLHLRLQNKGANFVPTSNYPVTTNVRMTGAAADFNGDGFVDLAEGGRDQDNDGQGSDTNLSIFISRGADPGNPTRFLFDPAVYINYLATLSTYEIIAVGAGDFNGDGDADIAALSWSGKLWLFTNRFADNHRTPGGAPDFSDVPTLVTNLINDGANEYSYTSEGAHFRWESNIECVDIDGDRDLDLIVGIPQRYAWSRYGEVVIFVNNGAGTFSRLPQTINPYNNNDTYRYGVCGVAAADFDNDGDIDFYCGSANSRSIYFYRNNAGTFAQVSSKTITIPNSHGSCTYLRQGDVDNDGFKDLVLATDGWTANPPGGYVYWYENDGTNVMTQHPIPTSGAQVSPSDDLDSGAVGDFDNDGDLDFFVADGNDSHNCYFFMNDIQPTYVDRGTVSSRNLVGCSFITSDEAVVSATIRVSEFKPAQTNIVYYLSNSDDQNGNPLWEGPVTPGVLWTFQSPGDFLRWQAVFTSSNELVTPKVNSLYIDYNYITKREYSRTSHAAIKVEIDSARTGEEEVLYSASFEFPKWRGHLRSWDVTNLDLSPNRGSVLKNILAANAQPIADAGALLASRAASSRIVYTAYDMQADSVMNDRVDFSTSQSTILENFLQLGVGSPEVPLLIDFVLGVGRTWKLGDINHSSPKALLPPSGTASMMGTGYDAFKQANATRRKLVFAGANDGMLHAFDAVTMDEAWAFIPNNLLYKLKFMRVTDPDCGVYLYHHFFVDGTATIKDVYFGGAWHTVLVTGQGTGWGKNHDWYYFALDITDPVAPRPLWEVTHAYMGETWSVPAVVKIASPNKWVAMFGSGYDTDGDPANNIGQYFYCVDIETGAILNSFEIAEHHEAASPFGIQNTLPGSCETVDVDQDGTADAVYFGDLKGRLWKIDLSSDVGSWNPTVIYRDPNMYPIITKPAVYVDAASSNTVHIYIGTGGDDRAPSAGTYSFVALIDQTGVATVEWYLGPDALATQLGISPQTKKGDLALGERVWADPVTANRIVYVATLEGNIESLNPCNTLAGAGRIYARYILGNQYGGTALTSELGAPLQYLQTEQKVRSAVTLGETQMVTPSPGQSQNMRKVFIQSYTQPSTGGPEPPSQVLAQPVVQTGLVIKQWREVYKVFKR